MKLEDQIARLTELGLPLAEGVTVEDLLYSFDRQAYESPPFDLLLFVYGIEVEREPWGRCFSPHVWNFDTECISGTGSYVRVLRQLCTLTGAPDALTHIEDFVDLGTAEGWISYQVDGKMKRYPVDVVDDWADMLTLSYVIDDLERDGYHFYSKDNGQAMILFYLTDEQAAELQELTGGGLERLLVA